MINNGRMSRSILTRLAAVLIGLAVLAFAIWAVQDVVAGPPDRDLGPVVVNTHEPDPSPTASESPSSEEPEPTASPADPSPTAPTQVNPAPPVVVDDDDD